MLLRDARDADSDGVIDLIGEVYDEYACVLDVDGEMPYARAIATYFTRGGGRIWVAESRERAGRIIASGAFLPVDGGIELHKLYLRREERGSGLASTLCDRIEGEGRTRGARFVELWSDTRFERAHRFYERRGYVRGATTRDLHDKSNSTEFYFRLDL
ncbi:MAG: N-acetyltransferase [Myxococcaceae bacterium]|jgi:putative acetyltransferase|nr:N-acetyltransferase [Myxococcaceae bacterium]